jgi:hypothetical protein
MQSMPPALLEDVIHIEERRPLSEEIVSVLEQVVWGTDEARYTLKNVREILQHTTGFQYFLVRRNGKIVAMRADQVKTLQVNGTWEPCLYHSMAAVVPSALGRGFGRIMYGKSLDYYKRKLNEKGIIYAYVETGNLKSLHLSESLGYRRLGQFQVIAFSRFFPKNSSGVTLLQEHEIPWIDHLLKERYHGHLLLEKDPAIRLGSYYVLKDEEGIVAGVQADFQRWQIHSLGGFGGSVARDLLPHIPLMRRIFNPDDFRFLKWGHVYVRKGREKILFELMEAVLARQGLHTGIGYFDRRSPVDGPLLKKQGWGVLRHLVETSVQVLGYFQEGQYKLTDLQKIPLVISPNDP